MQIYLHGCIRGNRLIESILNRTKIYSNQRMDRATGASQTTVKSLLVVLNRARRGVVRSGIILGRGRRRCVISWLIRFTFICAFQFFPNMFRLRNYGPVLNLRKQNFPKLKRKISKCNDVEFMSYHMLKIQQPEITNSGKGYFFQSRST